MDEFSSNDDFLTGLGNFGAGLRTIAEDARRGVTYATTQTKAAIMDSSRAPLDSQLPWYKRTWLYASDQEKIFIVLGIVGIAFAAWQVYKGR